MEPFIEVVLADTGDISSKKPVFTPQETLYDPCNVTLVCKDGEEFKAHRRVLSEASSFFERLLNSDMKESKEGVVRLEMFSELGLRDILEFIYTGSVQILDDAHAQELIAMADYLLLPRLTTLTERFLVKNLKIDISNAISTYHFAVRYRCQELTLLIEHFILANFTSVAKTHDFLELSKEEVKMWISSDDIDVNAEEDVFKIILTWVDHEKSERKKHFAELFREVRLVHVSRDYLHCHIVTNDLVNDCCMDLVKVAMEFTNSNNYHYFSVKPRKSLETPVIVVCKEEGGFKSRVPRFTYWEDNLLYYPREETWAWSRGTVPPNTENVVSCQGKLYFISPEDKRISCYDSFSNTWISLPYEERRRISQLFVRNEDEIYALMYEDERSCPECIAKCIARCPRRTCQTFNGCARRHLSFLTKYKPETNSWEDITSFDGSRVSICIVAKDEFVYFLGGYELSIDQRGTLRTSNKFDLSTNTWDKIADLQDVRASAYGTAVEGKIFVVGGTAFNDDLSGFLPVTSCEVYDETTNEWQFIANLNSSLKRSVTHGLAGASCDRKIYLLSHERKKEEKMIALDGIIECYDPIKNEWSEKPRIPLFRFFRDDIDSLHDEFICCSMRVIKRSNFLQEGSIPNIRSTLLSNGAKRKCAIM